MNIKQAKEEIIHTVRAYLTRDELGSYLIPAIRQRPVLLMGPPGIGKTQIMEQAARETGVGLVAYTITHHTRQSAIGLPFIEKRTYGGQTVSVTEYTMSEILSSVYQLMERTGLTQGILFLDEINCVSETLAPMMLQFLQCKTFGNQRLPEGWIIVAAGNPPEYNKSVREFDVVTLDRVKRIDVKEDYPVWKEYATQRGLHGAILSYLDIKKENFYRMENTVDGMSFVTARGWEDLSEILYAYEKLSLPTDRDVIGQYLQLPRIAKDFAGYLTLYNKYQKTYHVAQILSGAWPRISVSQLAAAAFDEKLSVMGLLLSRLSEEARLTRQQDELVTALHAALLELKDRLAQGQTAEAAFSPLLSRLQGELSRLKEAGQLDKETGSRLLRQLQSLEHCRAAVAAADGEPPMDVVRQWFAAQTQQLATLSQQAGAMLDNAFRFLEEAVGDSQEMVIFVTQLTAGCDTSWLIEQYGCEAYFRHNRELLFDDTRHRIREHINNVQ